MEAAGTMLLVASTVNAQTGVWWWWVCRGLRTSFAVAVSMSGVVRATMCGAESDCLVSMYPLLSL